RRPAVSGAGRAVVKGAGPFAAAALVLIVLVQGFAGWTTSARPRDERTWSPSAAPFPTAQDALATPDFRITAVPCWQGNWNYTFWSNLKPAHVASELRRIHALG